MADTPEQFSIWDALKAGNPDLAVTVPLPTNLVLHRFTEYPGFKDWLVSEYALGWPTRRIKEHLASIRTQQVEDLVNTWPELGLRDIDRYRSAYREDWMPIRARLSENIENVGVLAKNNRLLTLARVASDLEDAMWSERNGKTGQLYLLSEWRQVLRQIAEEKGELGEGERAGDSTLLALANKLAGLIKVQGSGQQVADVIEGEFTFYPTEADNAEAAV